MTDQTEALVRAVCVLTDIISKSSDSTNRVLKDVAAARESTKLYAESADKERRDAVRLRGQLASVHAILECALLKTKIATVKSEVASAVYEIRRSLER
jgi:hypothetical protein